MQRQQPKRNVMVLWSLIAVGVLVLAGAGAFALRSLAAIIHTAPATATRVYGQTNFISGVLGTSDTNLEYPASLALDSSGGLYVADYGNNRVLYYPAGSTTATRVYGQSSFASNQPNQSGTPSSSTLSGPYAVALDSSGGLYVADYDNSRVLYYPAGSTTATRVYGQPNFTAGSANQDGAPSASTLSYPKALAVDSSGGLYVTDYGNNRVLYYPAFTVNDMAATRVYGQPDFTSNGYGTTSATTLDQPAGLAVDSSGGLYVTDYGNNRVLYFPAFTVDGMAATRVYGQPDFTSNGYGTTTATTLDKPDAVAVGSSGGLYVTDLGNDRVLYYPAFTANGMAATRVYGQPDFTSYAYDTSATTLDQPAGLAVDSNGGLYVADYDNNRVLYYPSR